MKYGLSESQFKEVITLLSQYEEIEEAILFGSRAINTFKEASDVDVAIKGKRASHKLISDLKFYFEEETDLPFFFDFVSYPKIDNKNLKEHIDKYGVTFYRRGWRKVKLGKVCSEITYGYTARAQSEPSGPKFLRITDIVSDRIDWVNVPYCKISSDKISKYRLKKGDIVVARTGATTGFNKIIKNETNSVFASYLIRYKINMDISYPFYVGYVLQSSYWKSFVKGIISGSAQPGANAKQFAGFEFLLPSLSEQQAIAEVLSSLDDKIELLHEQNKTLEEMAQTLFRKWFIQDANPHWPQKPLDDLLSVRGGTTPSTKNLKYWNGDILWTTPKDLSKNQGIYLFDTNKKITNLGLAKISSGLLPAGTLLLSSRAPVGYLAFSVYPIAINQGYIAIIDDKGYSKEFIYLWLKINMEYVKSYASGSTFLEISKSSFKKLILSAPPKENRMKFDYLIKPLFNKIFCNQSQILNLEKLRNILLPKLITGQVRVTFKNKKTQVISSC